MEKLQNVSALLPHCKYTFNKTITEFHVYSIHSNGIDPLVTLYVCFHQKNLWPVFHNINLLIIILWLI